MNLQLPSFNETFVNQSQENNVYFSNHTSSRSLASSQKKYCIKQEFEEEIDTSYNNDTNISEGWDSTAFFNQDSRATKDNPQYFDFSKQKVQQQIPSLPPVNNHYSNNFNDYNMSFQLLPSPQSIPASQSIGQPNKEQPQSINFKRQEPFFDYYSSSLPTPNSFQNISRSPPYPTYIRRNSAFSTPPDSPPTPPAIPNNPLRFFNNSNLMNPPEAFFLDDKIRNQNLLLINKLNPSHLVRKHICSFPKCGRDFKTKSHLERHVRIHSGEKPYACPWPNCLKRCSRRDNMHQHYSTHLQGSSIAFPEDRSIIFNK